MSDPCIICVAITGSLPTKENNPAVPISIDEQVESTQEAFEAGATIAHCHVRDDEGRPTSDPERFARLKEGIERHCPGMIVQLSTGGRSGAGRERGGMLPLRPDMAVHDGDVVCVPRGHHPCGAPYGFEMYYLNVMAGPLRKWRFVPARQVEWIMKRDA